MKTCQNKIQESFKIATPVALSGMLALSIGLSDAAAIAKVDEAILGDLGLINVYWSFFIVVMLGYLSAITIITAQSDLASVAQRSALFGSALKTAALFSVITIAAVLFLTFITTYVKQSSADAFEITWLTLYVLAAAPALYLQVCIGNIVYARGKAHIDTIVVFAIAGANLAADYLLLQGEGNHYGGFTTAESIILNTAVIRTVCTCCYAYIILRTEEVAIPKLFKGMLTYTSDISSFSKRVYDVGFPIAALSFLEAITYLLFGFTAVSFGSTQLGAYHLSMTLFSQIFMISVGFGTASAVMISSCRQKSVSFKGCAELNILLIALVLLPIACFIIFKADVIAAWFAQTPELATALTQCLLVMGIYLIIEGAQVVLKSSLRAIDDGWMVTFLGMASYWLIGLPLALYLSVYREMEVVGLFIGLGTAIVVSTILYGIRYRNRVNAAAQLGKVV